MLYPNFRMNGIADYEEIQKEPPNFNHLQAQNIFEAIICAVFLGVSSGFSEDNIAEIVFSGLESYLPGQIQALSSGIKELIKATPYSILIDHCSYEPLRTIRSNIYKSWGL